MSSSCWPGRQLAGGRQAKAGKESREGVGLKHAKAFVGHHRTFGLNTKVGESFGRLFEQLEGDQLEAVAKGTGKRE